MTAAMPNALPEIDRRPPSTRREPRRATREDPVSPELVLVDPELAKRRSEWSPVLASVAHRGPRVRTLPGSPRVPTVSDPRPRRIRWVLTGHRAGPLRVLLAGCLVVGLLLTATSLAARRGQLPSPHGAHATLGASIADDGARVRAREPEPSPSRRRSSPAARPAAQGASLRRETARAQAPRTATPSPRRPSDRGRTTVRPADGVTRAMVERRILALVVQSPAGKLPEELVDPRTGLAQNNIQAVCRPTDGASFTCVVRPAGHAQGEGLAVRYVPGRSGKRALVWDVYRTP